MNRRFIIVNNGTTELRGHYFETAISVAESARAAGFHASLAIHVDCPVTGLPDWLDCHPVFRVDHWAQRVHFNPPTGVPRLGTVRRFRRFLKRLLPRFVRNRIRGKLAEAVKSAPPISQPFGDPEWNHDQACAWLFQKDLETLLKRLGAGPDDHVFLPTAHFREAYAIRRILQELGDQRVPRFHLEFRHGVIPAHPSDADVHPLVRGYSRLGQRYFEACRAFPKSDRVRCYTDTEELAEDYQHLCGVPFGVLPIPFTHELIRNAPVPGQPPYTCAYLGDIREEKGFQLLPGLVRTVWQEYIRTGRLKFLLQGTQIHPSVQTPALINALAEFDTYPSNQVELVGRDRGFLQRDEYYHLLARADIVLCPYHPIVYRARSSGILTEAIAAGKPVIVPANTWLSHQLPAGCGESFTDEDSLANALRKICERYDLYHARLQECRGDWLAKHSPAALLKHLLAEDHASFANLKAA